MYLDMYFTVYGLSRGEGFALNFMSLGAYFKLKSLKSIYDDEIHKTINCFIMENL